MYESIFFLEDFFFLMCITSEALGTTFCCKTIQNTTKSMYTIKYLRNGSAFKKLSEIWIRLRSFCYFLSRVNNYQLILKIQSQWSRIIQISRPWIMVSYIPEKEKEFTYLKWQIKLIVILWRRTILFSN